MVLIIFVWISYDSRTLETLSCFKASAESVAFVLSSRQSLSHLICKFLQLLDRAVLPYEGTGTQHLFSFLK